MRFILRSIFWLSLVFSALPDTAATPDFALQTVVDSATGSLKHICAQNAQECMNALAKLAAFDPELIPNSLIAPVTPSKLAKTPQNYQKTGSKDKIGTLLDNDLIPGWRASVPKNAKKAEN